MTARTEINAAEKLGEARAKERGANEANENMIKSLIQNGIAETETQARKLFGLAHLPTT